MKDKDCISLLCLEDIILCNTSLHCKVTAFLEVKCDFLQYIDNNKTVLLVLLAIWTEPDMLAKIESSKTNRKLVWNHIATLLHDAGWPTRTWKQEWWAPS